MRKFHIGSIDADELAGALQNVVVELEKWVAGE
jgi:hypothetical protein